MVRTVAATTTLTCVATPLTFNGAVTFGGNNPITFSGAVTLAAAGAPVVTVNNATTLSGIVSGRRPHSRFRASAR